jgi:hypothetical protein
VTLQVYQRDDPIKNNAQARGAFQKIFAADDRKRKQQAS